MSVVTSSMLTGRRDFTPVFADAYHDAALAQLDMLRVSRSLETVRQALSDRRTGLRGLLALDEQIGLAEVAALRALLVAMREEILSAVSEECGQALDELFASDPANGSAEWVRMYAAALYHGRVDFCRALVALPLQLTGVPPMSKWSEWTDAVTAERYGVMDELFEVLRAAPGLARSHLLIVLRYLADLALYLRADRKRAEAILEEMEGIKPGASECELLRGELLLASEEFDEAKAAFERSVAADPRSDAVYLIGGIFEARGDTAEAESQYRSAIAAVPSESAPYVRLLRLLGHPHLFETQEPELLELAERAAAADPVYAHSVYTELCDVYDRVARYEEALAWYDRASEACPFAPGPHSSRAFSLLNQDRTADAEKSFLRALELAPEDADTQWGLASVYEATGRVDAALESYSRCSRLRPAWASQITVRVAALHRRAGRLADAESTLLTAQRAEPHDGNILAELHDLIDELYKEHGDPEHARDLLRQIREIEGEAYEPEYQNRAGVMSAWLGDMSEAAAAYRSSLELAPDDPIVHMDLGAALRELGDLTGARVEVERAYALDEDQAAYDAEIGLIENARGIAAYELEVFDEAARCFAAAAERRPNDAVVHSNVADAWSRFWQAGERLRAVEEASAALRRAVALAPENEDYRRRLAGLDFERYLLSRFPEDPDAELEQRLLRIDVAADLVDRLLTPGTT